MAKKKKSWLFFSIEKRKEKEDNVEGRDVASSVRLMTLMTRQNIFRAINGTQLRDHGDLSNTLSSKTQ